MCHLQKYFDKCKVANIPEIQEYQTKIIIPCIKARDNNIIVDFDYGRNYIIKVANYILNPPENFTLNVNWNNGINPASEYMLVTPVKFVGKMIQFDGCGYDIKTNNCLSDVYSGLWLPRKSIEIIREEK